MTREEFLSLIQKWTEGRATDEDLAEIQAATEFVNSTATDAPTFTQEQVDAIVSEQVQATEATWREKYKETFFTGAKEQQITDEPEEQDGNAIKSYSELLNREE